jgi:hypothetical protein
MYIRNIHKVRERQHRNPEFGHKGSDIIKKPATQKTLAFKGG